MPPEGSASRNSDESSRDSDREAPPREYQRRMSADETGPSAAEDPDVLLDVPVLKVEELELEVDDLRAQVSVQAELADMVKLSVGVDVNLGKVKLGIKGVEAQALLKVRLENIRAILEQALNAIDRDPSILERLTKGVGGAGGWEAQDEAGSVAGGAAAGSAAGNAGETARSVRRTVDESGNVLKTVLDGSGEVLEEDTSESLADLPVEEEYLDDEGRIVGRARDDAGNVVKEELDEKGNVVGLLGFVGAEEAEPGATKITAPAERKARELGVDLSIVDGTGSGRRILVKDVERAAKSQG